MEGFMTDISNFKKTMTIIFFFLFLFSCKLFNKADHFPETWIISAPDVETDQTAVTFVWSGSDEQDQANELHFSYKLDEMEWSVFRILDRIVLADLSIGSHVFYVKARNSQSNEDLTPASFAFSVIKAAENFPDTWIDQKPEAEGYEKNVRFTFGGSDNATSAADLLYSYRINEQNWSQFNSKTSVTLNLLPDAYVFYVQAKNQSGQVDPTPAAYHFTIHHETFQLQTLNSLNHKVPAGVATAVEVNALIENLTAADLNITISLDIAINGQAADWNITTCWGVCSVYTGPYQKTIGFLKSQKVDITIYLPDSTRAGQGGVFTYQVTNNKTKEKKSYTVTVEVW
jgi:hypothetical protein